MPATKHGNKNRSTSSNGEFVWQPPMLLDAKQVAASCGVDRHEALRLMHAAGAVILGRRVRVRPQDLDDYLSRIRKKGVINS
jgi:hypothetical protein